MGGIVKRERAAVIALAKSGGGGGSAPILEGLVISKFSLLEGKEAVYGIKVGKSCLQYRIQGSGRVR